MTSGQACGADRVVRSLTATVPLNQLRCARVIGAGHVFIQNVRRGHYKLGAEEVVNLRVMAVFDELAPAI
jgi:hypothetical protein